MLPLSRPALRRAAASRLCTSCLRYNSSTASSDPTIRKVEHESTPRQRRIFSGIQPTGVPHLGNYLGALREWVRLQDSESNNDCLFSIVDLHAITIKQDPDQLRKWRKEMLVSLMAVGLDPEKSTLFFQSSVPQHSQLMWILSCTASMGYLSRMTQWKSKLQLPANASPFDERPSSNSREALKLGLFSYPVLQAADILLYRTTHVPVGEDQAQHLEFARDLANGFNAAYPSPRMKELIAPQTLLSPAKRVMSLKDPTKKMSKSDTDHKSRILITDTKAEINLKLRTALTDSMEGIYYDREARPGVSNLIDLMYYMDESIAPSPEELGRDMAMLSMRALKERVADTIEANMKPVRERYNEIMSKDEKNPQYLMDVNATGVRTARKIAQNTLRNVHRAMGLPVSDYRNSPMRKWGD